MESRLAIPLGEVLDFAQKEHLPAALGKRTDRLGQQVEFLPPNDEIHDAGLIIQDVERVCFRDGDRVRHRAPAKQVMHRVARHGEEKALGRAYGPLIPRLQDPGERLLDQVVDVGKGAHGAAQHRPQRRLVGVDFLRKPARAFRFRRIHCCGLRLGDCILGRARGAGHRLTDQCCRLRQIPHFARPCRGEMAPRAARAASFTKQSSPPCASGIPLR